jgi:outer membrane protein assembly factor BamB
MTMRVGERGSGEQWRDLWTFIHGGSIYSTVAVADGRAYVASNTGYLYAFGVP